MEYSERIRQLRTQKGVTQQQLADAVDVSRQSVVRWENGWSVPSMYYATRLAEYFAITVTELMTGAGESVPSEKPDRVNNVKRSTATVVFCVAVFLTVLVYALANELIITLRYNAIHTQGDTTPVRSTFKMIFGVADGLLVTALAAELSFWIIKLVSWLNTADDKYSWYRIYRPWFIGLSVLIINVIAAVFILYLYILPVPVLFIAAVFTAVPVMYIVDFAIKKAFGKRMVVPHNKRLDVINLVFAVLAAVCVVALVTWVVYAVVTFRPTYGLEVGFAVLYFCIAAAVMELSYVTVRVAVSFVCSRRAKKEE